MANGYRQDPAHTLDEQEGDPAPLNGEAVDARSKRHGAVSKEEAAAKDASAAPQSSSQDAKREQDRQLETGEENPV